MHSLLLALLLIAYRSSPVYGVTQSSNTSQDDTSNTGLPTSLVTYPTTPGEGITIHPTFSKPADCSASWNDWLILSQSEMVGNMSTFSTTWTYYNMTAQVTTLCDGHPRIVGGSNGLTTTATGTSSALTVQYVHPTTTFSIPPPKCLPPPAERTSLSQYWGVMVPNTTGTPLFETASSFLPSVFTGTPGACGPCSIYGGRVSPAHSITRARS